MNENTAILLAAGRGQRLYPGERSTTKGLTDILGQPLVNRVINFLQGMDVNQTLVVTGYQGDLLKRAIEVESYPTDVETIDNAAHARGSLSSAISALSKISRGGFYLFNVDHLFHWKFQSHFVIGTSDTEITAFVDRHRSLGGDDMKVSRDRDGNIVRISKTLLDFDAGYIGVTHVPASMRETYTMVARQLLSATSNELSIEAVLASLAMSGVRVRTYVVPELPWFEIDTPDDLAVVTRRFYELELTL